MACGEPVAETGATVVWSGPELALQDCEGAEHPFASLASERDALVLAIGAGWCGPCKEDAPVLETFQLDHPELRLASVLVEDDEASPATRGFCQEWTEDYQLSHLVLVDPAFLTEALVGADGFPAHVVLLPDGTQVYEQSGAFVGDEVLAALR